MKKLELLKVFIRREAGRTVCICLRSNKRCEQWFELTLVEGDVSRNDAFVSRIRGFEPHGLPFRALVELPAHK